MRKINFRVEFIFYNAKQVEYDFDRAKNERRKYGNYAKILSPEIVNNTNKIFTRKELFKILGNFRFWRYHCSKRSFRNLLLRFKRY